MCGLAANELALETEPEAGAGLGGSAQECAEAPGLAPGELSHVLLLDRNCLLRGCEGGGHSGQRMRDPAVVNPRLRSAHVKGSLETSLLRSPSSRGLEFSAQMDLSPRVTLDEELPRRILHPDILKDIACHPGPLRSSKMTFLASVAFLSSAPLTSLLLSFSVSSRSPQTFSSAFASCLHAPPGDLCTCGFSALSAALTPSPQLLRLPTRHPTARVTLPSDVQQGPDVACPH